MNSDVAVDKTNENMPENICSTPKDVEQITTDENENENYVAPIKQEQIDTDTNHSVDEVDHKADLNAEDKTLDESKELKDEKKSPPSDVEEIINNDSTLNEEKSLTDFSNSEISVHDKDDKKSDEKEDLEREAKVVSEVDASGDKSIEQSSAGDQDVLKVTEKNRENDKTKLIKGESTTNSTEMGMESLENKSLEEEESKLPETENKNVELDDRNLVTKDFNEAMNTENINHNISPSEMKDNNTETKVSLDDQENKENMHVNHKEITGSFTDTIDKKSEESKEKVKIKNIRAKSLSEERLKLKESNKDRDSKKTKRIKSVDSNKNNLKKMVSQTKIDTTSNEKDKPDGVVAENKTRPKRSLSEDAVKDNTNTEESRGSFDSSKLREEIDTVNELSKTTSFKTSYNPYKLRQEIKQASEDSNNNNSSMAKVASEIAAATKIQSTWRAYACRKSIKQIPKDTTNDSKKHEEEAHINVITNSLTKNNEDVETKEDEEKKIKDDLDGATEKCQDTLKTEADSVTEDVIEEKTENYQNSATVEDNANNNLVEDKVLDETAAIVEKSDEASKLKENKEDTESESKIDDNDKKSTLQESTKSMAEQNSPEDKSNNESDVPAESEKTTEEESHKTDKLESIVHMETENEKREDSSDIVSQDIKATEGTVSESNENHDKIESANGVSENVLSTENGKELENNTNADMTQEMQKSTADDKDMYINSEDKTTSNTIITEQTTDNKSPVQNHEQQEVVNVPPEKCNEDEQNENSIKKSEETTEDVSANAKGDTTVSNLQQSDSILPNDTNQEKSEQTDTKEVDTNTNTEITKGDGSKETLSSSEEQENDKAVEETVTKKVDSALNSENVSKSNINENEDTVKEDLDKISTDKDNNGDQNNQQTEAKDLPVEKEILSMADAVIKIQATWRGYKTRKQIEDEKLFGDSVEKEIKQKEDLELAKKIDKHAAISKIQAVWRGYKVRKNIKDVNNRLAELQKPTECDEMPSQRELSDEDIFNAATKIQAGVRGYMVRKKRSNVCHLKSITEENTPENKMADEEVIESLQQLQDIPRHSPEVSNKSDDGSQQVKKEELAHTDSDTAEAAMLENLPDNSKEKQMDINSNTENVNNSPEVNKNSNDLMQQAEKDELVQPVSDTAEKCMPENFEMLNNTKSDTANDKLNEKKIYVGSNTKSVDNQITGNEEAKNNEMRNTKEDNKKTENEVKFIAPELNSSTTNKLSNLDTTALIDDTISNSILNKDEVDPVSSIIHDEPGYEDAPTRPVTSNKPQESINNQNIEPVAEKRTANEVNQSVDKAQLNTLNEKNIIKYHESNKTENNKKDEQKFLESQESTTSADSCTTVIFNETETQPAHLSHDECQKIPHDDESQKMSSTDENTGTDTVVQESDNNNEENKVIKISEDLKVDNSINNNTENIHEENVCDSVSQINNDTPTVEPEIEKKITQESETANISAPSLHDTENDNVIKEIHLEENQKHILPETRETMSNENDNISGTENNLESSDVQKIEPTDPQLGDDKGDKPGDHDVSIATSNETDTEKEKENNELNDNKELENLHANETSCLKKVADADFSDSQAISGSNSSESEMHASESKTDDSNISSETNLNDTPVSQSSTENNKLNLSALESEIINANKQIQNIVARNSEERNELSDNDRKDSIADNSSADETKTETSLSTSSNSETDKLKSEDSTADISSEKEDEKEPVVKTDKDVLRIHIPLRELSEIKEEDGDAKSSADSVEDLDDESKSSKDYTNSTEDEKQTEKDNKKTQEIKDGDNNVIPHRDLESKMQGEKQAEEENEKTQEIKDADNKIISKRELESKMQDEKQAEEENEKTQEIKDVEHNVIPNRELELKTQDERQTEEHEKTQEIKNAENNATQNISSESKMQDVENCNKDNVKSENLITENDKAQKTQVNDLEGTRKKSASPIISLVHTGEFHDTITVPISVSPPTTSSKEAENQSNVRRSSPQGLVHTGELHDNVLPLSVQLNEAPPAGAEILTSQASESIDTDGQKGAQASNKDASACETQPDNTTSSAASMETEKRNNATTIPKKSMEAEAATKIQAGFRGYQVRKQLKNKISSPGDISNQRRSSRRKSSGRLTESGRIIQKKSKSPSDLEEKSAVKIQAGIRGFLVRRRQKKQKQGKESS
ncbi:putative leucine-rich repeat-containing protein DDB_G0290503 isoform X1 [Zophobas morio]|uniref:putative leucine-rich repeat-containing protein DDB_G0290503 isoform X1 n=1 Tax=Zophobas morio TaxID=2755281 RepID=UPI003083B6FA